MEATKSQNPSGRAPAFDWDEMPTRSDLMLVTAAVGRGWMPGGDELARVTAWAERAVQSGNARLRSRAVELFTALGLPVTVSRTRGSICIDCGSDKIHPGPRGRWTCESCGAGMVMNSGGTLRHENPDAQLRGSLR